MKNLFAATGPLLMALSACQPPASSTAAQRQIHSLGYGSVTVYPDYAELTVETEFTRPRLKDAVAEVQAVVDDVLTRSRHYAPGPNEVRVSSTSSDKAYDYQNNKRQFVGFSATQSVTVRLNNLEQLAPYMEELLSTRISGIRDLTYSHSRADSLRREAHVLALADARKTADKMCAALNLRRGAVLKVDDAAGSVGNTQDSGWGRPNANINLYSNGMGGPGFKTSPELLRFESVCSLTSALE